MLLELIWVQSSGVELASATYLHTENLILLFSINHQHLVIISFIRDSQWVHPRQGPPCLQGFQQAQLGLFLLGVPVVHDLHEVQMDPLFQEDQQDQADQETPKWQKDSLSIYALFVF